MTGIISMQIELRPELPVVIGNVDYTFFRETLLRMEEIIISGKLDEIAMNYAVTAAEQEAMKHAVEAGEVFTGISNNDIVRIQKAGEQALWRARVIADRRADFGIGASGFAG